MCGSRRPICGTGGRKPAKSAVQLFADCGLDFEKSSNERVAGWLALHELLTARDAIRTAKCGRG